MLVNSVLAVFVFTFAFIMLLAQRNDRSIRVTVVVLGIFPSSVSVKCNMIVVSILNASMVARLLERIVL